jgi:hypothetical protein
MRWLKRKLASWLLRDAEIEELTVKRLKVGGGTVSVDGQSITLPGLTADPALAGGKVWYRSDLSRIRYSPDGVDVISIDPPLTAADVWSYSNRTLTQSKFPFWSAIITQVQGSGTSGFGGLNIDIQPPPGETWWVTICFSGDSAEIHDIRYYDFDGSTARLHGMIVLNASYENVKPFVITRVLTNKLYARLYFHDSNSSTPNTVYYGYSGFKLSQPLWSPKRLVETGKPFKLKTDLPLPDILKPLDKYKALILGLNPAKPKEYALGIILEEDTPLAIDPETNFPVERKSVYVEANFLADLIRRFKSGAIDYVKAGYEPYLKKWKSEGIDFGIL